MSHSTLPFFNILSLLLRCRIHRPIFHVWRESQRDTVFFFFLLPCSVERSCQRFVWHSMMSNYLSVPRPSLLRGEKKKAGEGLLGAPADANLCLSSFPQWAGSWRVTAGLHFWQTSGSCCLSQLPRDVMARKRNKATDRQTKKLMRDRSGTPEMVSKGLLSVHTSRGGKLRPYRRNFSISPYLWWTLYWVIYKKKRIIISRVPRGLKNWVTID